MATRSSPTNIVKTTFWSVALGLFHSVALGDVDTSTIGKSKLDPGVLVAAGPHERVWTSGDPLSHRRVTEIGTGMNYWDGEQWSPSEPVFEMVEDGFVANRLQYKVRLAAN